MSFIFKQLSLFQYWNAKVWILILPKFWLSNTHAKKDKGKNVEEIGKKTFSFSLVSAENATSNQWQTIKSHQTFVKSLLELWYHKTDQYQRLLFYMIFYQWNKTKLFVTTKKRRYFKA